MNYELLAEDRAAIETGGMAVSRWNWQAHAAHQRRGITAPEDLTAARTQFLLKHGMVQDDPSNTDGKRARGPARALPCRTGELDKAGLRGAALDPKALPEHSAVVTLRFRLITPMLTRDDDAFYLFDNPVRKDHIFGVPFLAAASIKGLAADAFQRGFPHEDNWAGLGKDDQARTLRYRADTPAASRLFGIASDDPGQLKSESGRLHFEPAWFPAVQFIVMNPMRDDASGIGTQPIQFEAIAPVDDKGKPVTGEIRMLYFNPAGASESDETLVRSDLACLVGACAAWWPALGLGAKRLAGYGAVQPLSAECAANGWKDWKPEELRGSESWSQLATKIAGGRR